MSETFQIKTELFHKPSLQYAPCMITVGGQSLDPPSVLLNVYQNGEDRSIYLTFDNARRLAKEITNRADSWERNTKEVTS